MNIKENWSKIRTHFRESFSSNIFVSIASVDASNHPTVTPIGSFFLNKNQSGFYFEKFTTSIPKNAKTNRNVCVLAVNSSKWFWFKSLLKGKFDKYPAVKLYGILGDLRPATPKEMGRFKRRVKLTKGFKGYKYLWGDMTHVRDITFTHTDKIKLGATTQHL